MCPAIGAHGQARIESSSLRLPPGLSPAAADMAYVYGEAAGLRTPHLDSEGSRVLEEIRDRFRHSASKDIGLGAACALDTIAHALTSTNTTEPDVKTQK